MILESVRYYVRYASFYIFRSPEIVSEIKGFRLICVRLTDKFSRLSLHRRIVAAYRLDTLCSAGSLLGAVSASQK